MVDADEGQAPGRGRDVLGVFGLVAVVAAGLLIAEWLVLVELPLVLSDPVESAGLPEYTGMLTNFGIVLLWSSAVVAGVGAWLGRFDDVARRRFVASVAVVVGVLALDDLFMVHEWLGHQIAMRSGVADPGLARQRMESFVFGAYIVAGAVWTFVMRRQIWRSPWVLFVLGVAGFGLSVGLDLLPSVAEGLSWVHGHPMPLLEELAKLLGICGFGMYAVRTALPHLRSAGSLERRTARDELTGDGNPEEG